MKRDRPDDGLPTRLVEAEDGGEAAELLRKFERQAPHAPPESAAWERTLSRLAGRGGPGHRMRLGLAAACGVLAGALGLYLLVPAKQPAGVAGARPAVAVGRSTAAPVASPAPLPVSIPTVGPQAAVEAPLATTEAPAVPGVPRIQLGQAAVGLPIGQAELLGEARVTLWSGGSARAFADQGTATIDLAAGELDLQVKKRDEGQTFDVVAGGYRFKVLGTTFRIALSGHAVALWVSEGRVAVYRGSRLLTVVGGGGRWASPGAAAVRGGAATSTSTSTSTIRTTAVAMVAPGSGVALLPERTVEKPPGVEPAAFVPAVSAPVPAPAGGDGCVGRAGRDARAGIDCYLGEARGGGLRAEVALYEVARLRRDALGDAEGALRALREHRRRFPVGVLSAEVGLSIAELLPKLGRYAEALDETAALLDAQPRGERAGELHLLRGHVLREGLGDCGRAERAYAVAASASASPDGGRAGDPAAFWRAVCLETLGRADEARAAYRQYLSRPRAARAAEAKKRLGALSP